VYAETRREVHTTREDLLGGLLRFADGSVGGLQINWLTPSSPGSPGHGRARMFAPLLAGSLLHGTAGRRPAASAAIPMLRGGAGSIVQYAIGEICDELEAFLFAVAGSSGIVTARTAGRRCASRSPWCSRG
jgi:hypothetical protein